MSYLNPSQWVLPLMYCDGATIEIRINVANPNYDLDHPVWPDKPVIAQSGIYILDPKFSIWTSEIDVGKGLANEDNVMICDQVQLSAQDTTYITGTHISVGGSSSPIIFDFLSPSEEPNGLSLFGQIFSDLDAKYTMFATYINGDGTNDLFFEGDISIGTISKIHGLVHRAHTENEQRTQAIRIVANCALDNITQFKVSELIDIITADDMVNSGDANFFAGIHIDPGYYRVGSGVIDARRDSAANAIASNNGFADILVGSDLGVIKPFCYGNYEHYPDAVFPAGRNGMKFTRLLKKLSYLCDFYFDEDTDFDIDLKIIKATLSPSSFSSGYSPEILNADDLCFCYNTVFGISPLNGLSASTPISFDANAALKDILIWVANQFNCYVYQTYNQEKHAVQLKVLPRDVSQGDKPDDWILVDKSSEEPKLITKKSVLVTNTAADGGIRCPLDSTKDSVEVEIKLRAKKWGNLDGSTGIYDASSYIPDNSLDTFQQVPRCASGLPTYPINSVNSAAYNPDSWLVGAYVYFYHNSDTNIAYPDSVSKPLNNPTWQGFYAVAAVTEKADIYARRDNFIYANAQKLARQMVGNRYIFSRDYYAPNLINGRVSDILPNITCQIRTSVNQFLTFRAINLKITPSIKKISVAQWEQVIDYSLADLSVEYIAGANQSTGSSAGSGTGTGSGSSGTTSGSSAYRSPVLGVRLIADYNITIASPPLTLDSRTLVNNDVIGLFNQTDKKQNGLYRYTIADHSIARLSDILYNGLSIAVNDGKYYQGTRWQLVGAVKDAYIIGTDDIAFTRIGKFKQAKNVDLSNQLDDSDNPAAFNEIAIKSSTGSLFVAPDSPIIGNPDAGALEKSLSYDLNVNWENAPNNCFVANWYADREDFAEFPFSLTLTGSASVPKENIIVSALRAVYSYNPSGCDARIVNSPEAELIFYPPYNGWYDFSAMVRFNMTQGPTGPISFWIKINDYAEACLGWTNLLGSLANITDLWQFNGSTKLYISNSESDVVRFGLAMEGSEPFTDTATCNILTDYICISYLGDCECS